jgi:hypothetical protein
MLKNETSLLEPTTLGRTGLKVGRLGMSASYGMPAAAVGMAFDRGMNYLYWGSLRRGAFADALRHLKPQRERMVLVVQSYMRMSGSTVIKSREFMAAHYSRLKRRQSHETGVTTGFS